MVLDVRVEDTAVEELERNEGQVNALVHRIQTARDPLKDGHAQILAQGERALLVVRLGRAGLDSLDEVQHERVKGVLVHEVGQAHTRELEVEHRTLGCHQAVRLTSSINALLRLLALLHSGVDLRHGLLRRLQALDERHVGEDILGRVGEALKQVILKLVQLDLVALERRDKVRLRLLQVCICTRILLIYLHHDRTLH